MSRDAFAKKLGVSSSIVYLWESGRRVPRRSAIVERLEAMVRTPRSSPAEPHAKTTSKRSRKVSPQRRAALKLQGRYIGLMRSLSARQKKQIKEMKAKKGFEAAIRLAEKTARK
jgi:ribosome-binding protein aMBF1 (putative translation factor)